MIFAKKSKPNTEHTSPSDPLAGIELAAWDGEELSYPISAESDELANDGDAETAIDEKILAGLVAP